MTAPLSAAESLLLELCWTLEQCECDAALPLEFQDPFGRYRCASCIKRHHWALEDCYQMQEVDIARRGLALVLAGIADLDPGASLPSQLVQRALDGAR